MYKLEMHVHTSPTSRCASAKAEDAVAQYTQADYHGLVLTNQINKACQIMRIFFMDHVIITDGAFYSYHDKGKL